MSLPDNLKRIRKERRISQEELAEELDVSRQAISKWEQGICLPEAKMLLLISEKLNVSLDDLMSDSLDPSALADAPQGKAKAAGPRQIKIIRKLFLLISAILIMAACVVFIASRTQRKDEGAASYNSAVGDDTPGEAEVFTTKADRERIFELSCAFAEAYFARDVDAIGAFLSLDFTGNPKAISPWEGIDAYFVRGVDSISTEKANGIKVISIEFRNPDYPDSFIYLTLEYAKQDGDWKVRSYYMDT